MLLKLVAAVVAESGVGVDLRAAGGAELRGGRLLNRRDRRDRRVGSGVTVLLPELLQRAVLLAVLLSVGLLRTVAVVVLRAVLLRLRGVPELEVVVADGERNGQTHYRAEYEGYDVFGAGADAGYGGLIDGIEEAEIHEVEYGADAAGVQVVAHGFPLLVDHADEYQREQGQDNAEEVLKHELVLDEGVDERDERFDKEYNPSGDGPAERVIHLIRLIHIHKVHSERERRNAENEYGSDDRGDVEEDAQLVHIFEHVDKFDDRDDRQNEESHAEKKMQSRKKNVLLFRLHNFASDSLLFVFALISL